MVFCPLTMNTQAPPEDEEDFQVKEYSLARQPDDTEEEVRRDRLAHLLLMGLKAVKASPKCNAEVSERASSMKRANL